MINITVTSTITVQASEASSSRANGSPPEDDMHLQQLEAIRAKIRVSLVS